MQRRLDRMNVAGHWTTSTILIASALSIASVLAAGFFLRRDLQVRAQVEARFNPQRMAGDFSALYRRLLA